jgi:hypothetical protein
LVLAKYQPPSSRSLITSFTFTLGIISGFLRERKTHNAGLQLRRAISIQAEGKKLLEKHAVAPSAARLCYVAALRELA